MTSGVQRQEFEQPDAEGATGQLVYSKRHGWHLAFPRAALAERTGVDGGRNPPASKRRKAAAGAQYAQKVVSASSTTVGHALSKCSGRAI